jgi:gas vesicle structural protein
MPAAQSAITRAPRPSSLADVLDLILDKGLVIDAYVRVAALGIEILTIDARIVIASVDTYLHYAEAVNRLDLTQTETQGIKGLTHDMMESGAKGKTQGAIEGVKEAVRSGRGRD